MLHVLCTFFVTQSRVTQHKPFTQQEPVRTDAVVTDEVCEPRRTENATGRFVALEVSQTETDTIASTELLQVGQTARLNEGVNGEEYALTDLWAYDIGNHTYNK